MTGSRSLKQWFVKCALQMLLKDRKDIKLIELVEEPRNLIPTPQQIAVEQTQLDELGPYVFHSDKAVDEKLQKALGIEDSLRISFGVQAFNHVCELATNALLPAFRQKHAPKGSTVQEFTMDGDDRLLRSNVILNLLRSGVR